MLPHCGVFDELWIGRVPDKWIYDEKDVDGFLAALQDAASSASKQRLLDQPIKASWRDATDELLAQYKGIIKENLPNRQTRGTIVAAIDSLMRAILGTFIAYWVVRSYTKKSFKIGVWLLDHYILDAL